MIFEKGDSYMQKGFSLRALVDISAIPLTTLRNYRQRGIISPDVANQSGKFTLYSDAQIEFAKTYRSKHPPKNDKNQDADADDSTPAESNTAGKKAYLVNPPESLGVKFNRLNIYLRDNGAFEVDAHFDTTHIETAYRRFVDFFLQAAADIPALNGWENFPNAKKLIPNTNGWENELGEQIFFKEANDCLCVDLNEDTIYIFGKFNQQTSAIVTEPQHDLIVDNLDKATISINQPAALETASIIDTESLISEPLEGKSLLNLETEIKFFLNRAAQDIIEIGRRLIAAKSLVAHGHWHIWLDDNFGLKRQSAQNFMNVAQRFGANYQTFGNLSPSTLINMLALSEGDEEEFIATQAAAGKPVEKQSAREVQKNVKAFKQHHAVKKLPDDDKLPTLQGLSLSLDESNDTPLNSSVTTDPKPTNELQDDRADVPAEETDDSPAIIYRDSNSDALPAVDTLSASINASTDMISNSVDTPAQVTAVNVLIAETNNLQQLRTIRFSLTETLASLDSKLKELAQEN